MLTELYQNPDDQAAIEASRQSFEDNLFEQFDGGIPFVNGTDDWPMIVARNILEDRRDDGAGDPAGVPLHFVFLQLVLSTVVHVIRSCITCLTPTLCTWQ